MPSSWGVVVPVKRLALAKSRLSAYGDSARESLALAFAADVVTAALACSVVREVVVVTDDVAAAELLGALGARIAPDDPDAGLNPALEHGAALLRARYDDLGIACLSADLPAMRPGDLAAALALVGPGSRAFVADTEGSGTTLLAAGPGAALLAAYGPGSQARHRSGGGALLQAPDRLRQDVDTPADLAAVMRLGVGPHTIAATAGVSWSTQATVRDWDRALGGTALLDIGRVLALPPGCLQGSAFRHLRSGQRVQLHLLGETILRADLPGR